MVELRLRGQAVLGNISSNQLENLSSSPLASPSFTNNGESTVGGVYQVTMQLRRSVYNNDTTNLARRAEIGWHLETTVAGTRLANTVVTGASAGSLTTGGSQVGTVFPGSTLDFTHGRAVSDSTGGLVLAFTSTGTSTGRLFITLPNGLIIAGSTLTFT